MSDEAARALLLTHAFATTLMTGLIWFVQVVHYPLMRRVGEPGFVPYALEHQRRTGWVVGPLMLAELTTAVLLVVFAADLGVAPWWTWGALAVLVVVWGSTAFLQVPMHRRLGRRFDLDDCRRLVRTNWIRTIGWSLRAAFALLVI
jgi:hypothetical protein